jgi:hypothetical protein
MFIHLSFPAPFIDTARGTKMRGATKGQLDSSSSGTDNSEDEEGHDGHKLAKIRHAIHLGQLATVILKGQYEFGFTDLAWRLEEVQFQQVYTGVEPPTHSMQPLQAVYRPLEMQARRYGGEDMPRACAWSEPTPRENIEITVEKQGKGARVVHSSSEQKGIAINSPKIQSLLLGKLVTDLRNILNTNRW